MLLLIPDPVPTRPEIRVGCIGAVEPADMRQAVAAMGALPGRAA